MARQTVHDKQKKKARCGPQAQSKKTERCRRCRHHFTPQQISDHEKSCKG